MLGRSAWVSNRGPYAFTVKLRLMVAMLIVSRVSLVLSGMIPTESIRRYSDVHIPTGNVEQDIELLIAKELFELCNGLDRSDIELMNFTFWAFESFQLIANRLVQGIDIVALFCINGRRIEGQ